MLERVAAPLPLLPVAAAQLAPLRVAGGVALGFEQRGAATVCARISEADGYRVRLPASDHCEAVILNTGGGVAGGDAVRLAISAAQGAEACVTSVAAERLYRSNGPNARLAIAIDAGDATRLAFLPQETILFDGARLSRRITVEMAGSACVTLFDMLVFGRRGSGERMTAGALDDQWSVRRDGRLIHREALRIDGAMDETLARAASGDGAHVLATLLHLAPEAGERLDAVRNLLPEPDARTTLAASAWNGRLVVRALARDASDLIPTFARLVPLLTGFPVPRLWNT